MNVTGVNNGYYGQNFFGRKIKNSKENVFQEENRTEAKPYAQEGADTVVGKKLFANSEVLTGGMPFTASENYRNLTIQEKTDSEEGEVEEVVEETTRGTSFLERMKGGKKAPYSFLADETGQIHYNGVTFFCDNEKQQLCLGDTSDPKKVLRIPLSKGGCLMVNRDNLGDLSKAIGMFSAEDVERILRAIAQDTKAQQMQLEIEETENDIGFAKE